MFIVRKRLSMRDLDWMQKDFHKLTSSLDDDYFGGREGNLVCMRIRASTNYEEHYGNSQNGGRSESGC